MPNTIDDAWPPHGAPQPPLHLSGGLRAPPMGSERSFSPSASAIRNADFFSPQSAEEDRGRPSIDEDSRQYYASEQAKWENQLRRQLYERQASLTPPPSNPYSRMQSGQSGFDEGAVTNPQQAQLLARDLLKDAFSINDDDGVDGKQKDGASKKDPSQSPSPRRSGQLPKVLDPEDRSVSSSTATTASRSTMLTAEDDRRELKELRSALQAAALSVRQQEELLNKRAEDLEHKLEHCEKKERSLDARELDLERRERAAHDEINSSILKWKEEFLGSPEARKTATQAEEEHLRKIHRQLQQREDDIVATEQEIHRDQIALSKREEALKAREQELQEAEDSMLEDAQKHMERFAEAKKSLEARERSLLDRERKATLQEEKARYGQQENERMQATLEAKMAVVKKKEEQLELLMRKARGLDASAQAMQAAAERLDHRESHLWEAAAKSGQTHVHSSFPNHLSVLKTDLESLNQQLRQAGNLLIPPAPAFTHGQDLNSSSVSSPRR